MTRLLIVVHGMGSNPPGWSDSIVQKLDSVASRYSAFSTGAPFSKQCTIREVRYDGVFERHIEDMGAKAAEFKKFQDEHHVPLPKLMEWLTGPTLPSQQQSFFWSTLMDAILYRAFAVVRDEVRAVTMAQIVSHCTANMRSGAVQASILAHSLGTAVVHDTLQLLATKPQLGNDSFTAAAGWHFESLFMLADVCRLGPPKLIDLPDADAGYLVRPRSAGTPGDLASFYCNSLYSFRHEFDPFVRWAPFLPKNWGDDFDNPTPLKPVCQANVHGFDHYLDNPVVHVPIINDVLGFSAISTKEALEAVAHYPPSNPVMCTDQVNQLQSLVSQLPDAGQDLEQMAILGAQFFTTAKQLANDCKALGGDLGA